MQYACIKKSLVVMDLGCECVIKLMLRAGFISPVHSIRANNVKYLILYPLKERDGIYIFLEQ